MSGLTARPFPSILSHRATIKQKPLCVSLSYAVSGGRLRVGRNCCLRGTRTRYSRAKGMVVVARVYGGSRKELNDPAETDVNDPALDIDSIRSPSVRLIDEEQNMVGIVSTSEAIQMAEDAELDLVILSPNGDPPVVKIMDYSKYKYDQQKKKREQQKRSTGSYNDIKELKMGCNIDIHDYSVRLRAARRFLQDGHKVKFIVQFKGREFNFTEKAINIFERYQNDLKELAILETKSYSERYMFIVLQPIKGVMTGKARTNNSKKSEEKPMVNKGPMTKEEPVTEEERVLEEKPIVIAEEPMTEVSSEV